MTPGAVRTISVERYRSVRDATEALARPLSAEDQTVQTMPDVSPTKWHRAHVTWFFEQFVLLRYQPGYRVYDERFLYLFNSYYEAAGPRHPRQARGLVTRPGVGEVAAYRQVVDDAMGRLLDCPLAAEVEGLVELGLHHEQQHQELLLMDIKHVLGTGPLQEAYSPQVRGPVHPASPSPARPPGWVAHPGGLVTVGHDRASGFGYDNEGPPHRVWLEPFALADRLITTGEWLTFMADGGYQRAELWLSDGWAALAARESRAPLYWSQDPDGHWMAYTLGGLRGLDPTEPVVHLNYYEADAYAHWAGARLPTEFEWEAAAQLQPPPEVQALGLHPTPAPDATTAPATGLRQLYGSAWQWTSSGYLPYPRFRPAAGAVGEYNGKFMVGQHTLRGSAAITPPGHTRVTYRNFFPPSARWVMAGVRLARDVEP